MNLLALGGSIRATGKGTDKTLREWLHQAADLDTYLEQVKATLEKETQDRTPSNTEILCGAALLAAKNCGANVDYFPLVQMFSKRRKPQYKMNATSLGVSEELLYRDTLDIDPAQKKRLVSKIRKADGIILSSPVYFGDRSSVCNKAMQFALKEGLFSNKLVAALSAGAKRNGGQETTNIYLLSEALSMGANVVGNGPAISQYGGTAWAGDRGSVISDRWGMETAYATGRRIAQAAQLFSKPAPQNCQSHIVVLITMDTPEKRLARAVKQRIEQLRVVFPHHSFCVVELLEGHLERCLACNICPIPEHRVQPDAYSCIIQTRRDSMAPFRDQLLNADGIILAGMNLRDMDSVCYRYQAFTERSRFIRRNDFELTNVAIAPLVIEEAGATANSLFALKVMTSYIRHNTVICPPLREIWHGGQQLMDGHNEWIEFLRRVEHFKACRSTASPIPVSYKAGGEGGYKDTRLDSTQTLRV